jgi:hypothetical protein
VTVIVGTGTVGFPSCASLRLASFRPSWFALPWSAAVDACANARAAASAFSTERSSAASLLLQAIAAPIMPSDMPSPAAISRTFCQRDVRASSTSTSMALFGGPGKAASLSLADGVGVSVSVTVLHLQLG